MQFMSNSTQHISKHFLSRKYSLLQSFKISWIKYVGNFTSFDHFHEIFYPADKIDLFIRKIKEPQFFSFN